MVAEVEYEPCAEELRLCGGEGKLSSPSEPRAPGPLDIKLLSPLPFSMLGAVPLVKDCTFGVAVVFRRLRFFDAPAAPKLDSADSLLLPDGAGVKAPDKGLGGRLDVRTLPRGGCGKAFMLIVFLTVFPEALTPGVVRNFGRVEFVAGPVEVGRLVVEGTRSPLFGKLGGGMPLLSKLDRVGIAPVLLRAFIGNAGSAVVGGP